MAITQTLSSFPNQCLCVCVYVKVDRDVSGQPTFQAFTASTATGIGNDFVDEAVTPTVTISTSCNETSPNNCECGTCNDYPKYKLLMIINIIMNL